MKGQHCCQKIHHPYWTFLYRINKKKLSQIDLVQNWFVMYTAVQGLRFRCYSWAWGYHSWTREPRHPVHVTDVYAAESQTPLVRELSLDHFSVGLLLHCSPPMQGQSGGMGKGVWRPGTTVLSSQCGKTTHLLSLQITTNSSSL